MKTHVLGFISALREAGLSISTAEAMDAMRALAAVGVEAAPFREGLAATLVKDEADRPTFDTVFDRFFALPPARKRNRAPRPKLHGTDHGCGQGTPAVVGRPRPDSAPHPVTQRRSTPQPDDAKASDQQLPSAQRLARTRALARTPFQELSAHQLESCEALVAELARRLRAHIRRRQHAGRHGRLDVRRTIRRSITKGGVPIEPFFRERRPARPDLVALCDCSYSVATASHFLLALLTPATEFFRRVCCFGFVDQPVSVSFEFNRLVPHEPLDLYARSDFGKVLTTFWDRHQHLLTRNTVLLVLGDARNNRRPPRADLLRRMHDAVRLLVWLNPEAAERWNTADSVMRTYERHCDTVIGATNVRELHDALRRSLAR